LFGDSSHSADVFGETPKTAAEMAAPKPLQWLFDPNMHAPALTVKVATAVVLRGKI
jgi:hypothetical protein